MATLETLLRPGMRVAVSDGMGAPRTLSAELSSIAADRDLSLVLGWLPTPDDDLVYSAFTDVVGLMGGWGLRKPIGDGTVRSLPLRWSTVPALIADVMRPDVLLVSVVPHPGGGWSFGTEVSWMQAVIDAGAMVAGVVSTASPVAYWGPPLPDEQVTIVGQADGEVAPLQFSPPEEVHRQIAENLAPLVTEGGRVQVGPGAMGGAVLDAISVSVRVDSGLLPDGVVALDRRGLLLDVPVGTYLAGGAELLEWADGRPLLHRVEHTHDLRRLTEGPPFFAINTALEVDDQGNVNVEGSKERPIASPGGHPDYAAAGARSVGGLSIIALPSEHRGRPTLVDTLSGPVTTAAHDVDVVVTERGAADLRGLSRSGRAEALHSLWS